jgi:hypothetical protein
MIWRRPPSDEEVKPYICDYCGSSVTKGARGQHALWHHALAKLLFCPTCEAKPGEDCFDNLIGEYTHLHDARVMLR